VLGEQRHNNDEYPKELGAEDNEFVCVLHDPGDVFSGVLNCARGSQSFIDELEAVRFTSDR
jgi:hypothetical protein